MAFVDNLLQLKKSFWEKLILLEFFHAYDINWEKYVYIVYFFRGVLAKILFIFFKIEITLGMYI